MPPELQSLGDGYVRDEFKRHKKCNEQEANLFMIEWTNYAVQLSKQLGLGIYGRPAKKIGTNLEVDVLDQFSENQIVQLYELMKAARNEDGSTSAEPRPNSASDDKNATNKKS